MEILGLIIVLILIIYGFIARTKNKKESPSSSKEERVETNTSSKTDSARNSISNTIYERRDAAFHVYDEYFKNIQDEQPQLLQTAQRIENIEETQTIPEKPNEVLQKVITNPTFVGIAREEQSVQEATLSGSIEVRNGRMPEKNVTSLLRDSILKGVTFYCEECGRSLIQCSICGWFICEDCNRAICDLCGNSICLDSELDDFMKDSYSKVRLIPLGYYANETYYDDYDLEIDELDDECFPYGEIDYINEEQEGVIEQSFCDECGEPMKGTCVSCNSYYCEDCNDDYDAICMSCGERLKEMYDYDYEYYDHKLYNYEPNDELILPRRDEEMNNKSSDASWKESIAHISLLKSFSKARDTQQVLSWSHLKRELKENPEDVIHEFIIEGMLVKPTTEEIMESLFQSAQLKKLLKERYLKVSGSKRELIDRLIEQDPQGVEQLIKKYQFLKCSTAALNIITQFEENFEQAHGDAKQESLNALMKNNPKEAYKAYVKFQRISYKHNYEPDTYTVEVLQNILASAPKILSGISRGDLKLLRIAACMEALWHEEKGASWLPSTLRTGFEDNQIAINYLLANARINRELAQHKEYNKKVKVVFRPGDIDSCELCQSLSGKGIDIDDFPELPMVGCTSETGCKCDILGFDDNEEGEELHKPLELTRRIIVNTMDEEDILESLRKLKQMLDEHLITQDDYDKKKAEVLERL